MSPRGQWTIILKTQICQRLFQVIKCWNINWINMQAGQLIHWRTIKLQEIVYSFTQWPKGIHLWLLHAQGCVCLLLNTENTLAPPSVQSLLSYFVLKTNQIQSLKNHLRCIQFIFKPAKLCLSLNKLSKSVIRSTSSMNGIMLLVSTGSL